jgi:rubrerythrin
MNPMIVTNATGAKTMPIGMTVAPLESQMTGSELTGFAAGANVNSIFLANLLSAFTAHERCGARLYRTAARMTQFPEWRDKYEEFLAQTEDHVRILSELVGELGGDPMYVSPQARMTEFQDTKLMEPALLAGSVDNLTMELAILEAVLLAERKCHANWELLGALADQLPDSAPAQAIRRAVDEVEDQENEHVRWAQQSWGQALLAQITAGGAPGGAGGQ